MKRSTDSAYESREMLLERVRRQRQTITDLIAEREALRKRLAFLDVYRVEASMLRAQLRSGADLLGIVRRFREAVRDKQTGDFIGGANRRRILADVDDAAVQAISSIAGGDGAEEKQKEYK